MSGTSIQRKRSRSGYRNFFLQSTERKRELSENAMIFSKRKDVVVVDAAADEVGQQIIHKTLDGAKKPNTKKEKQVDAISQ